MTISTPAIRLYVGGSAAKVRGQRIILTGYRCFTAAHSPVKIGAIKDDPNEIVALLDSGAFTDPPAKRLTPDRALDRQIEWERRFSEMTGTSWKAEMLASYDLLIDEKWGPHGRRKERWTVIEGERAVTETIAAARYLASRRRDLWPRGLVLACQGVEASQYDECVTEVLRVATPDDCIGFGGWCILGRWRTWIPVFLETCWRTFSKIARAGVCHVHIFGMMYEPALAPALWLADEFGLCLSVDSSKPVLACTWSDPKKAGVRAEGADANVRWWIDRMSKLRESEHYRKPARFKEQQALFARAAQEALMPEGSEMAEKATPVNPYAHCEELLAENERMRRSN